MSSDAELQREAAEGTTASTDGKPIEELPLPPYPSTLRAPPKLHFLHAAVNPIGFGEHLADGPDVVRFWMPGRGDIVNAGHPDMMKRVLLTEREKFAKTDDFKIAFGEGLLTVEGEEWRAQRDTLQPLFTRDSVMDYADGMVEQVRRRTRHWEHGDRLDLQQEFTRMTLDVLSATVLGRELALDGDERLRNAAESLHDWFTPSSYVLPHWVPTLSRNRFGAAKETLQEEVQRLLDERATDPPTDPGEAEDLLSLLVGLREAGIDDSGMLSDERLRDQMVTIIFAGHDTTTTSLTFACWALANYPSVRERFHEEVDALDGPPTLEDVEDLQVTDRVLTEALRMYPPVHTLPRKTRTAVAANGYRIPVGTRVHLPIMGIQRDERFFDEPDTFRPSRWTDGLRRDLHNFAYAPFGGGPRICIGREFALLEAKLTLATIGREFHLAWHGDEPEEDEPPVSPQMTLRMAPGQEFEVVER